ncbi:MAG: asparagine synthase-related protein [Sphingomonadales bacterium]
MNSTDFLAVLHPDGREPAALAIAERGAPTSISRLPIKGGGLLLCRWDGHRVDGRGIVTVLDGTGGAPEIPLPRHLIDADNAPAGLVAAARQYRSYLWLDDGGRLTCWTDHLGFSRIYHAAADGCLLLSDDPMLLAGDEPAPDLAGVGSFLVNGYPTRERTIFAGVSRLPPASIVALAPEGVDARSYWRPRPGSDAWADRRDIEDELWRRLRTAVLAATDDREAMIALSGGHDSAALLGILHAAGRPIRTFSFVFGESRPDSDADAAQRRAAFLGVEHKTYRFDQQFDIVGMLRSHVEKGLVLRKPCYEAFAFDQVLEDLSARGTGSVILFGDEALGQGAFRIGGDHELLGSAAIKSPSALSRIEPHLPPERADALKAALWAEYEALLVPTRLANFDDAKDVLFLDSYLRGNMVEMRRQILGRHQAIALPLLDLSVMDMARHVPPRLRTGKHHFKSAARRYLPDLYRLKGALHSQGQPAIGEEMRRQAGILADVTRQLDRGIPGVMSPDELVGALEALNARPVSTMSPMARALRAVARPLIKRDLVPPMLVNDFRRRFWGRFETGTDEAALLLRALHLSMIFNRPAADDASSRVNLPRRLSA